MSETGLTVYGTSWCPDVRRTRQFLDQNEIAYDFIDIDRDAEAATFVEKTNNGYRSVPTILFPDGSTLTEPSTRELRRKFGL